MKKRIIIICSFCFLVYVISGLKEIENDSPVKKITSVFLKERVVLEKKVTELYALFNSASKIKQINTDSIKSKIKECRIAYKKMEWAISYYYPSIATRINGTDVIDEEEPTEFEPAHGLQVIENISLGISSDSLKLKLITETERLKAEIKNINEAVRTLASSSNSELFAALKYEIIKVTVTGFTEYDNPIVKNYLNESAIALRSVHDNLSFFKGLISDGLIAKTDKLFGSATDYIIKHSNIDKFNRLEFIINHSKPLSLLVDEYMSELNIKYISYNPCVNLEAKSIFDIQSFNYFYSDVDKSTQEARIKLGKNLFFDPILSSNNKRACASCHKPEKAFTDGFSKSTAFDETQTVSRNAPTILNSCLQVSFFDDSRAASLDAQINAVVNNPKELNSGFDVIISKLKKSKQYSKMFEDSFPGDTINATNIKKAIADYEKTLVGFNSDFDKYINGEKNKLTSSQINGFNLFMGKAKCGSCHFLPLFNGMLPPLYNKSEFEIIGALETNNFKVPHLDTDEGVGPIKKAEHLKFGFKVPSLRNAAVTAPYMHNGAMKTLDDVLTFYNKGGGASFGLKVPNQTLAIDSLGLNKQQIKDIIHFIESLTDTIGLTSAPAQLPKFEKNDNLNARIIGGVY